MTYAFVVVDFDTFGDYVGSGHRNGPGVRPPGDRSAPKSGMIKRLPIYRRLRVTPELSSFWTYPQRGVRIGLLVAVLCAITMNLIGLRLVGVGMRSLT